MGAKDDFSEHDPQIDGPGTHCIAVTYDDANDLPNITRALYFGAAGNVKVTTKGGETLVIPVFAGGRLDLRVTRVWNSSTTVAAGNVFAIW